jgi:hypothetical protein
MPSAEQTAALEARRIEVAQYQQNINTFQTILATLPNELPEHLQAFRSRADRHAAAAEIENLDDVALVSDVWFYDELQGRVRSETVEMRKAAAILAVLEAQV